MLSLSLLLKQMQTDIANLQTGGSLVSFDTSKIKIGVVDWIDGKPSVNVRPTSDGTVFLDFQLANPVTNARQFGVVVAASTMHHRVDRFQLTSTAKTLFNLTKKANECPIVVTINGFSYVEGCREFSVDSSTRQSITWNAAVAGFSLDDNLADTIYVRYEVSNSVNRMRETIQPITIANNKFTLLNTPNATKVVVIINGVAYFEDGTDPNRVTSNATTGTGDFTVNRASKTVTWNTAVTGFSIDSSLTGYITVCYEMDI